MQVMKSLFFAPVWGMVAILATAAQPEVSNRPPKPEEIGYRPADGSSARLNPPSFIWLHDPAASHYSFQWAQKSDFSSAFTATNLAFNTYTHSAAFAPGTWYWRYQFTTSNAVASTWSKARSVVVPPDA